MQARAIVCPGAQEADGSVAPTAGTSAIMYRMMLGHWWSFGHKNEPTRSPLLLPCLAMQKHQLCVDIDALTAVRDALRRTHTTPREQSANVATKVRDVL